MPRRLTNTEVAALRGKLISNQGGRCAICGAKITGVIRGGAVLDHDHDTGYVRAALCRTCNSGEGKIKTSAIRYGGGKEKALFWLKRLVAYLELHETPQTQYLYPERKKPAKTRRRTRAKTS